MRDPGQRANRDCERPRFEPALEETAGSLAPLDPGEGHRLTPLRLALVRVEGPETYASLATAHGLPASFGEVLQRLNAPRGEGPVPGALVKVVE